MDSREFTEHYRQYLPMVSKFFAYRAESADVEDLASQVFSIAWQKRDSAPLEHVAAWLYRIAGNVLANHRRKSAFRITLPLLDNDLLAPSAESLALANVSIRAAWQVLSSKDRLVLSLVALEGLTLEECAVVMRTSKNAATIRFHRAKKNFEIALKESEG
jgi:RNA polymerase sigma-70 factor (ECF subfamily)